MIYNGDREYRVKFYKEIKTGKSPALDYIERLGDKEKTKIWKYVEFLRINKGYLDKPYSKHIKGKIRELRVDFSRNRHRILYFSFVNKTIIILHVFLKKTAKTPVIEIKRAEENCYYVLTNQKLYE